MQKSNRIELRVTDMEKKDWQEAAGGSRLVSEWLRRLANEACRLRREPTLQTDETHVVPGKYATPEEIAALAARTVVGDDMATAPLEEIVAKGVEAVIEEKKVPLSTAGALIPPRAAPRGTCPRAHHHRPGRYCGACKKVATKVGE